MKKRILSIFLTICMSLLPVTALAAEESANVQTYPIWVGGEQITDTNSNGDGWSYDKASNNLTLDGYTYSGNGYKGAAIYGEGALNITLKGENQIVSYGYYGIYVKKAVLTIGGDGTLDVEGTDFGIYTTEWNVGALTIGGDVTINAKSGDVVSGSSYGIRADGAFTIKENAVVTAQSGYAPFRSCGIYAYTTLDICDDAVVTAISGSSTESDEEIGSYGIRTTYMTVSGGTLTTMGATAKYDSCGIYTQTFEINDGNVTAIGGTASAGPSIGIMAAKSIDINGGILNAGGGDATANGDTSCGLMTGGSINVSGGIVTAETGSGGYTRAIEADYMSVTGGTIMATASDAVLTSEEYAMAYSSGIQALNGLNVENGTIIATGGNAANYSYGIQVASDANISGGEVTAKSGNAVKTYGFWAIGEINVKDATLDITCGDATGEGAARNRASIFGGYLNIECDEVIFDMQGTPRLIGTHVTAKGPVYVENGINVGEKLTVSAPVSGMVTEVTGVEGTYYTIMEEDGTTVSEQIEIKPLSYTVKIYAATTTMAVPVPAGQSVNETYCNVFEIEDFSEAVNVAKEGYIFEGWYTDEAYSQAFDFDMTITEDITLYGKWIAITYNVTYVADNKEVATLIVEYGKDAIAPEIPTKEGYTAVWDHDGKNITADMTITAVYTEIPDLPDNSDIPKTDDSRSVGMWLILMGGSCGALMIMAACNRKKHSVE